MEENYTLSAFANTSAATNTSLKENSSQNASTLFELIDRVLWKYVAVAIVIVGVVGNLMTIAVFTRKSFRHTITAMVLGILAGVDTFKLLWVTAKDVAYIGYGFDVRITSEVMCKIHTFLSYYVAYLSPWLLVTNSIAKVIAVTKPLTYKILCTRKRILCVLGIVCLLLLGATIVIPLAMTIKDEECGQTSHLINQKLFDGVFPFVDLLLASVLPFVVILICSVILTKAIIESMKFKKVNATDKKKESNWALKLVYVTNIVFLFMTIPLPIYFLWSSYGDLLNHDYWLPVSTVAFILDYANSMVNPILYGLTAKSYRDAILEILCPKRFQKSRRSSTASTRLDSVSHTTVDDRKNSTIKRSSETSFSTLAASDKL